MDIKKAVKESARELLHGQGDSFKEYARRMGSSPNSTAQKFDHDMRISSLIQFCEVMNIDISMLIERIRRKLREDE